MWWCLLQTVPLSTASCSAQSACSAPSYGAMGWGQNNKKHALLAKSKECEKTRNLASSMLSDAFNQAAKLAVDAGHAVATQAAAQNDKPMRLKRMSVCSFRIQRTVAHGSNFAF